MAKMVRGKLCRERYSSYMFTQTVPKEISTLAPSHNSWGGGIKGGGHLSADSDNNGETDDK